MEARHSRLRILFNGLHSKSGGGVTYLRNMLPMLAADPELARLHAAAVAWRHARFAELMQTEDYRALFGRLMMTPPSHPLPRDAARKLIVHARRSQGLSP